MPISVVIPTLNEEKLIARTVGQWEGLPIQVIVGDGGSTDRTKEIVESLGAQYALNTEEPQTIAKGRNLGASKASGDLLIFCDADTKIKDLPGFLEEVQEVFKDPRIVGAVPKLEVFPDEKRFLDRVFHFIFNGIIRFSFKINKPACGGQCQVVRKSAFDACGGYPAEQIHAEDTAMFKKLAGMGRVKFLKGQSVLESPRRYRHYGYPKFLWISFRSLIGQALFRKNVIKEWKRVG